MSMPSREFCLNLPKVELHVHLEGSMRPETLLRLAERNKVALPASDLEGLERWYQFRDFPHFVEVYVAATKCIQGPEDIWTVAKEFLEGQQAQNIFHSEVTYTATTVETHCGIPFDEQMDALSRAMEYGKNQLGVSMLLILDIVRGVGTSERALQVAEWCKKHHGKTVCALGLSGVEGKVPASTYQEAFAFAKQNGVPIIPHAGETQGVESVWDALNETACKRIGHGVRSIEDPKLIDTFVESDIVLEVCPSSNICLGVFPSIREHSLPRLIEAGVKVTLNSDDPPMFSTDLTNEYVICSSEFGWDENFLTNLSKQAVSASLLTEAKKAEILAKF